MDPVPDRHPVLSQATGFNPATHWLAWERFEQGAWKIYGLPIFQTYVGAVSEAETGCLPVSVQLAQNYPNPFNPSTVIEFFLPHAADVTLKIYSALGEEVAVLIRQHLAAGSHKAPWQAGGLPSGIYFCRLQTEKFTATQKLVLLR